MWRQLCRRRDSWTERRLEHRSGGRTGSTLWCGLRNTFRALRRAVNNAMKRLKFDFSNEEFSELIAAAKEAQVRWKKARTLWKVGHHAYLKHNEQELTENINRFKQTEQMLLDQYKSLTGNDWHR